MTPRVLAAPTGVECDRARLFLHAGAGVPQTWIIDLQAGRLEVHRQAGAPAR